MGGFQVLDLLPVAARQDTEWRRAMFIYLMSPPDNGHTGRFQFLDIYINNSAVTRFGPFLDQKKNVLWT